MTNFLRSATLAAVATVFATVFAAPAAVAQGSLKIAYVNSQRLLAEAPGRAEAEAQFDKEAGAAKARIQRMDDSLKTLVTAFEKDAQGMDSVRREARANVVRSQEQDFQVRAQKLNQDMQQRQQELARPLMDQVSKVLDEFRAQGNYAMIFDVGSPANVVVSADKSLDLTDQVLARLKQLGPPKLDTTTTSSPASTKPTTGPTARPAGVTRPRG